MDTSKEVSLHIERGEILERHGKTKQALAEFRYAAGLDPKNALAHYGCARLLHQLGQLDDAEQAYRRCLDLAKNNYDAVADYARLLERIGRLDAAHELKKRSGKVVLRPFMRPHIVQPLLLLLVCLPWLWTSRWYFGLPGIALSLFFLYQNLWVGSVTVEITPKHITYMARPPFPFSSPIIRRRIDWSAVGSVRVDPKKKVLMISPMNPMSDYDNIVFPTVIFRSSELRTILDRIQQHVPDDRLDLEAAMRPRWPPPYWQ